MSLQSWKDEFYPVVSVDAIRSKQKSIKHSILKWTGLSKENLKKHNLMRSYNIIFERSEEKCFNVDDTTCALCQRYIDYNIEDKNICHKCPLYKHLGNASCDAFRESPYGMWMNHGDNSYMLDSLKALLKTKKSRKRVNKNKS